MVANIQKWKRSVKNADIFDCDIHHMVDVKTQNQDNFELTISRIYDPISSFCWGQQWIDGSLYKTQ